MAHLAHPPKPTLVQTYVDKHTYTQMQHFLAHVHDLITTVADIIISWVYKKCEPNQKKQLSNYASNESLISG